MCYEKPGPRCSGHTRTNLRAAQANLAAATNDLREKAEALKGAQSVEAQTALQASEKAHAQAIADLKEAEGKYQVSKEKRAVAMEAYREAKAEYDASPEGIKKNRIRSANPKLTAEERKEAQQDAVEGAMRRKEQIEALKAEQGTLKTEEQWMAMANSTDESVRRSVASDPKAHIEALRVLTDDDNEDTRLAVAKNPSTDFSALIRLANNGDKNTEAIHAAVNSHPTVIAYHEEMRKKQAIWEEQDRIEQEQIRERKAAKARARKQLIERSKNADIQIRIDIASSSDAPLAALRTLAEDPKADVRSTVALNSKTPNDIRDAMRRDPDSHVRRSVASRTSTPEVLRELAGDQDKLVRMDVARNDETPHDVRITFVEDKNEDITVRSYAYENLNWREQERYSDELSVYARHKNFS